MSPWCPRTGPKQAPIYGCDVYSGMPDWYTSLVCRKPLKDNSVIAGISPGYTINNQGAKVLINNETLALSTAFGYDVMKRIDELESRLRTIEGH